MVEVIPEVKSADIQPQKDDSAMVERDQVIETIRKMYEDKPFVTSANNYGKAVAASILAKSAAVSGKRVNFDEEFRTRIEFKGGSYALIYKGVNTPARLSPFLWQLDQGRRRTWAVFTFNNFYGHKDAPKWKFWKNIKQLVVITPYENSSMNVDDYGKGALAKFDEATQFQMPLGTTDSVNAEQERMLNRQFISAALSLWQDLLDYVKAKINWKLLMYLGIGAGVIIFAYWFISTHPGFLTAIFPH